MPVQVPPTPAEQVQRWRAAVALGLLVAPFFPASNVLFYPGTVIGERLLYLPSGAAQLCADCRCWQALGHLQLCAHGR